jgi:hypothetical protein
MVETGDEIIIFPRKVDDIDAGCTKGMEPEIGDEIAFHPIEDGSYITHGTTPIQIGDEVVIKHGKDFPLVAIRPGLSCFTTTLYSSVCEKNEVCSGCYGGVGSAHWIFESPKPFYVNQDPLYIINAIGRESGMDCFQQWYLYGGIWLEFSEDGITFEPAHYNPQGDVQKDACEVRIPHSNVWIPQGGPYNFVKIIVHNTPAWACCTKSEITGLRICLMNP